MSQARLDFVEVREERIKTPFCQAVMEGLRGTPKTLPTRYLYDQSGSELFERITDLPEYYLTRTERSILEARSGEIVEAAGSGIAIVEFGSGSSSKTRLLIEAALSRQPSLHYIPIDISADFLKLSAHALLDRYPALQITALASEYFDAIAALPEHPGPRLIIFLGSNIGNFTRSEAGAFLGHVRQQMKPHDRLLIGIDLVKDREILEAAYNDSQGVTAEFNRNLLRRINRELDAHFDESAFLHHAPYDEVEQRIEMRLIAQTDQLVAVDALGETFRVEAGEYIHTEWSHKYTPESFTSLCHPAGLEIDHLWTDERQWFGLTLLRPRG